MEFQCFLLVQVTFQFLAVIREWRDATSKCWGSFLFFSELCWQRENELTIHRNFMLDKVKKLPEKKSFFKRKVACMHSAAFYWHQHDNCRINNSTRHEEQLFITIREMLEMQFFSLRAIADRRQHKPMSDFLFTSHALHLLSSICDHLYGLHDIASWE